MNRRTPGAAFAFMLFAALFLAACGGGGGGISGDKTAGALVLVDVSVAGFDGVALNEILVFEFSEDLDPDTVRPDTIQIREGPNYGKQVAGFFRVDGHLVEFYPRLPILPDLSDGGFQTGKPYRITIPGNPKVNTVRSFANDHMRKETQVNFQTALAGTPDIFTDNFLDPLPPKILFVNPPDGAKDVAADSELTLTFNRRPLDPATVSVSNIRLWMETRMGEAVNRPIPISPVLLQTHDSVQVIIKPTFPLADVATYRIEVDRRVQDLVGNDVTPFVSSFSIRDEEFRTSAFTLTFNDTEKVQYMDETGTTASWNEAEEDALAALFTAAGGNGTAGDLRPTSNRNFTPDDFNRGVEVMQLDGIEYDVYNFRSIDIPQGVTVRFSQRAGGPNRPIALRSLKNVVIAGTLTVSGGIGMDGEGTNYTTSRVPLAEGGECGPGGGDGSDNDTTAETDNPKPKDAEDVTYGGGGGKGGGMGSYKYSYYNSSTYWYKYAYSYCGGGGGGGGSRQTGQNGKDGNYPTASYRGKGGKGGLSEVQRGFINLERAPCVGGAGGGAGGKGFYNYYQYLGSNVNRTQYFGGAGAGGGGGGGLTVQGAGDVTVASTGQVLSDGGDGGLSMKFYAYAGGGGGGGAGGTVKLVATGQVHLESGATISVRGGKGGIYTGTYTYYWPGPGGDGAQGYIRLEALEDVNAPGKPLVNGVSNANLSYGPVSLGTFSPQGGGAPSIALTKWINLGVYDPVMIKPSVSDIVATILNDTMTIEVQMATEDPAALGNPDLSAMDLADLDGDLESDDSLDLTTLSEWTKLSDVETLNDNHYQFIRIRVAFQLDDTQKADHPLPFLDILRLPFGF